MSKVIVIPVNNCAECFYFNRILTSDQSRTLYRCERSSLRTIAHLDNSPKNRDTRPEIPEWCPLEDYGPKFEDV